MMESGPTSFFPIFALISAILAIFRYIRSQPDEAPKLYHVDSPLSKHLLERCKLLTMPFRTAWWARNHHVQTILGNILPNSRDVDFDREYLHMADGGVVAIDWAKSKRTSSRGDPGENCPVLLVLPGLTGDASGMSQLCKWGLRRGFRPVVFNKRGHGGSELATPKLQSFGDPVDFYEVVRHVHGKYPTCKLTAVGFSAGSGLLASYLGEYGSSCMIAAAVFVSAGYDAEFLFEKCVRHPYDFILLHSLKKMVSRHATVLGKVVDIKKALSVTRLMDFEEQLYCKLYGYKTMKEYWQKNNPVRDVDNIAIPTLCVSALDDPVCKKEAIDYSIAYRSPNFMLATTSRGGHCGFLEGHRLARWANKLSLDYFTAVLEYQT